MKNLNFGKLLPYLAAIAFFLLVTIIYFSPLLEGKKIFQTDIMNYQGMSKEIHDYRDKTGEEALWTNSMFGGMPAYQISVKYSGNVIGYLDKILKLGLPHPANLVFLYFLGFFILLLVLRVNPWLAIAGATAFAFSSYFFIIIEAGHNSKAHAIGYMAFVFAGIFLTMQRKYLWGGILTAIALSLELKTNHPQITYYLLITAFLYGIFELYRAIRAKEVLPFSKAVGVLFIAGIFALLTNITNLWATYEYGKYTIRGQSELTHDQSNQTTGLDRDYATQWSYGIGETMTLMIPNFKGGSSNMMLSENSKVTEALRANGVPEESVRQFTAQPMSLIYWGDQPFTSGPVYAGAIMIFLFVLGLLVVKGPVKWWLLTATVLSVMLAWGHNFMTFTDLFLNWFPGYNKFRAVTMILVIAEFTIPLLGILAVKELLTAEGDRKKLLRPLFIAFGIVGGIALTFTLIPGMFFDFAASGDKMAMQQYQFPEWLMQAFLDERARLLKMDALRSLAFITLAAATLYFALINKIRKEYAYLALIVFILADMFPVNKRYLNNDSFTAKSRVDNPFSPSAADTKILEDKEKSYRVLNLNANTFNDAGTSYFHQSIGGYHGAKLRRYQEIIDFSIQPEIRKFASSLSTDSTPVINMLNTRYLILPNNEKQPVEFLNVNALGNAWFVQAVQIAGNADEEIRMVGNFKPDSVAVVDKRFESELSTFNPGHDSLAKITLKEYQPNRLVYEAEAVRDGLVVFSEIYYPKGWNATIDGKPSSHFRANYVLRAMMVPAGKHTIEFRFEPVVYHTGETISRISSLLLLVIALAALAFELFRARKKSA